MAEPTLEERLKPVLESMDKQLAIMAEQLRKAELAGIDVKEHRRAYNEKKTQAARLKAAYGL